MKRIRQKVNKMISLILIIFLIMMNINTFIGAFAKTENNNSIEELEKNNIIHIADKSTVDEYKKDMQGGRYNGRVWTDKSVYANNGDGQVRLDDKFDIQYNDDFLTAFSAISSSQSYKGLPPAKTIIVIDNSGSMYDNSTNFDETRISKTISAVNETIDELMRKGDYNQVGVVLFGDGSHNGELENSNTAKVIVPVGHYPVSENPEEIYKYLDAGWGEKELVEEAGPEIPIQEYNEETTNKSNGFVYVDKRYVNDSFKVNDELIDEKGLTRYETYRNGTTNIQAGIYEGFKALIDTEKYVIIGKSKFKYTPNMIFLSDGAATDMLEGVWSNPADEDNNIQSKGYSNEFGNKQTAFDREWTTDGENYSFNWNMFVNIENIEGIDKIRQIGYGDGSLLPGHTSKGKESDNSNPNEEGKIALENLAQQIRSSQANMMLSTLMTAGYMKAEVEKEYESQCQVYTISVDMSNPEDIVLPEKMENSNAYEITSSQATMNPKYFNKEYLKEKGYLKSNSSNEFGENDTAYEPYTMGSETILGMTEAIDAWNEWKNNKSSTEARDKLREYVAWKEKKGMYTQMKDGEVVLEETLASEERRYPVVQPIGPNHENAYFVEKKEDVTYPNLIEGDKKNNPYNLSDEDVNINYVKEAYYTTTTSDTMNSIKSIFDEITDNVIGRPFIPIGNDETLAETDNILSYVDPIGKYMEIKDVLKLLLFGQQYEIIEDGEPIIDQNNIVKQYYKAVSENGEDLQITNSSYRKDISFMLSDIKIWKEIAENDEGNVDREEFLYINIPNVALPIKLDYIELDSSGNVSNYETNVNTDESLPIRILYTVGIRDEIIKDNIVDLSKVSEEYIANNSTIENGKEYTYFYSNDYSSNTYRNGQEENTTGNAYVKFTPSSQNRFYVFQKNLTIYKNSFGGDSNGEGILAETGGSVNLTGEITDLNSINKEETYYFAIDYYVQQEGNDSTKGELIKYAVAQKGEDFYGANNECYLTYYNTETDKQVKTKGEHTVVATKIGQRRIGDLRKLSGNKEENITETASIYYAPEYSNSNNKDEIIVYLGNNGRLAIRTDLGSVEVIKTGEDGVPLEGAIFGLYAGDDIYSNKKLIYQKGEEIDKETTKNDGIARFASLYAGVYEIKELQAPDGYILLNDVINFELNKENLEYEVTVENEKEPEPTPDPDPDPEPAPEPDPIPEPEPIPDPEPEPEPDPIPEPEPEPEPTPDPEPDPEPEPDPIPDPDPEPEPIPDPEPEPEPIPEPEPEPTPAPKPKPTPEPENVYDGSLPKTGNTTSSILITVALDIAGIGIFSYRKYRKYKDI